MAAGSSSPKAERRALGRAIAMMERSARRHLGFAADAPLSAQKHANVRGQMDCFDESDNTQTYLFWLKRQGFLRYHKPLRRVGQRGFLLDGRYPHKTALVRSSDGTVWAVDSWRGRDGQPPEIMRFTRWKTSDSSDFPYDPSA
ncbi:hypothetical protein [Notoacmeibacter ruber]|nr:hypothetical protein [Notoacmeibacter ruber]